MSTQFDVEDQIFEMEVDPSTVSKKIPILKSAVVIYY